MNKFAIVIVVIAIGIGYLLYTAPPISPHADIESVPIIALEKCQVCVYACMFVGCLAQPAAFLSE